MSVSCNEIAFANPISLFLRIRIWNILYPEMFALPLLDVSICIPNMTIKIIRDFNNCVVYKISILLYYVYNQ